MSLAGVDLTNNVSLTVFFSCPDHLGELDHHPTVLAQQEALVTQTQYSVSWLASQFERHALGSL